MNSIKHTDDQHQPTASSKAEGAIWYAVYTKPRWEKKVSSILTDRGIENYCPLNRVTRQWSDRKKTVLEPLFKGYIFVCPGDKGKWDIKKTEGIINYVYWLGKPAMIREAEIENIRKFLQEFDDVEVTEPYAGENDRVMIRQGIMMDYKGIIIEVAGNKAKVQIESMGIQLTAVFERKNLLRVK